MFNKKLLFFFALHCLTTIEAALQRRFKVEVYNVSCEPITTRMQIFECNFQKIAISQFNFQIKFMFDKNIDKNVELRIRLAVIPTNGKTTLNFLDVQMKMCDLFSQPLGNMMLKIVVDEIRRSSNLPYECPMQGNFLYKLENYTLVDTTFPPYAPYMNSTLTIDFYETNQIIAKYIGQFALVAK